MLKEPAQQEISSEVAFWILDAWQRMNRPLLVSGARGSETKLEPAGVYWVSPDDSKVSLALLSDDGQGEVRKVPLVGARFSFYATVKAAPTPEHGGGFWRSQLIAKLPDGKMLTIVEPVVPSECLARVS